MADAVIIIGGGFAGMQSARRLRKRVKDVTLIDAKQFFEFTPGMHCPFAKPSAHADLVFDYSHACAQIGVKFVWGYVTRLEDRAALIRRGDMESDDFRVPYDYCIVAVGCQYGLPIDHALRATAQSECLWYPTIHGVAAKGMADTLAIQYDERTLDGRRLHLAAENSTIRQLAEERAHVAVIGAGFVGVEFALELAHCFPQLQITLVERREAVTIMMPPAAREYAQRRLDKAGIRSVYNVDYLEVMANIEVDTFWRERDQPYPVRFFMATGLRPHADFMPATSKTRQGWIKVNEYLQVVLGPEDSIENLAFSGRVFAAGNCVGDVPGIGRLPKNVFPAEHMAVLAVANVLKLVEAKGESAQALDPMSNPWPGSAICALSLGPQDGVCALTGADEDSGYTVLKGRAVILQKETIRWSKVDEFKSGVLGGVLWSIVGH